MSEDEKNFEDMDVSELESLLWHGVADGSVKPSGLRNGEGTFALTDKGEQTAIDLFGGKEVLEVAKVLNSLFVKNGVMGFPLPEGHEFILFTLIAKMCHVFHYYGDWKALLKSIKESKQ